MNTNGRRVVGFFGNIHFWIITLVTAAIIFIYYNTSSIIANDSLPWFNQLKIYEYLYDLQGILLIIPLVYTLIIFGWKGATLMWIISAAAIYPHIIYFTHDNFSLIRNIILSALPILLILLIPLEQNWRDRIKQKLTDREKERQIYTREIFKAQESERGRISQELHDDTIQTLLVIANRARVLASDKVSSDSELVKIEAERIRDGILQVSDDIHRLSLDLRPSILDNSGLVSAIFWLVDRVNESQTSVYIKLNIQGQEKKLRPDAEVMIFRIIQEAMNNARRHANATNIWVTMKYTLQTLTITIRDDGKGFKLPKSTDDLTHIGKLGITGIQERVKALDGKVYFRSKIGKGTLVTVKIDI